MNAAEIARRLGYSKATVNGWTVWKHHTASAVYARAEEIPGVKIQLERQQ